MTILEQQKQLCALGLTVDCDGVDGPKTQAAIAKAKASWGDNWELPLIGGIDVSIWQGVIDWGKVAAEHRAQFAYLKASDGVSVDPRFHRNWDHHQSFEIPCGPYHFFQPEISVKDQITVFLATFKAAGSDLPPAVDVEVPPKDGKRFASDLGDFLDGVEHILGRRAIVYTGVPIDSWVAGASDTCLDSIASHELWIAAYVRTPAIPKIWADRGKSWRIWQQNGGVPSPAAEAWRIAGIDTAVDRNVLAGVASVAEWASGRTRNELTKGLL